VTPEETDHYVGRVGGVDGVWVFVESFNQHHPVSDSKNLSDEKKKKGQSQSLATVVLPQDALIL
jgi:hypothetical protein